jgi:hypothetical protein
MAQVQFDIPYSDQPRNRGTVAIRVILAIPHEILMYVLQMVNSVVTLIHWFIQVFTGKRNAALTNFSTRYLNYATHVWTYAGLMYDPYPGFLDDNGQTPVQFSFVPDTEVNRLTVLLRIFWMIPAAIISYLLTIAGTLVTVISWFAILFTGTMPRGMFDFLLKAHRYVIQTVAYGTLLSDDYPKYG